MTARILLEKAKRTSLTEKELECLDVALHVNARGLHLSKFSYDTLLEVKLFLDDTLFTGMDPFTSAYVMMLQTSLTKATDKAYNQIVYG